MADITLQVQGMTCNHCKMAVEKSLQQVEGVTQVDVNLERGSVQIQYDAQKTGKDQLEAAIDDTGFDVAN
ncbi:MAG: copper-binding protein [Acidobacteria bacterium]|nr:MAG: copper-binding protein [Acidobacteriota bacterium]